ncbi:MAG TPA: aldose 1-epimerase [Solirubrobacteraceae bacterium]|nr:aldose 1-epimerase [Solirubrobacteraceae bacterium]
MTPQTVTLTSADGGTEAEFVPEANMVCCSLRYRGVEWLEQRLGLDAYVQQGKTMGIPLLHPWANRLERPGYAVAGKEVSLPHGDARIRLDGDRPIHGVMPAFLHWELVGAPERSSVKAKLSWTSPELLEVFPFTHELELEAAVGDGLLTMETTLYATGYDPVPVAFGYHPYLRIPGTSRTTWQVKLGAFRRLVLDERMIPTGERHPVDQRCVDLGDSSWDDAFDGLTTHARFDAATGDSSVEVEFLRGYAFAQVFAPPGTDYICFEPMTAPANALNSGDGLHVIAPGEDYRTAFRVRLADGKA